MNKIVKKKVIKKPIAKEEQKPIVTKKKIVSKTPIEKPTIMRGPFSVGVHDGYIITKNGNSLYINNQVTELEQNTTTDKKWFEPLLILGEDCEKDGWKAVIGLMIGVVPSIRETKIFRARDQKHSNGKYRWGLFISSENEAAVCRKPI